MTRNAKVTLTVCAVLILSLLAPPAALADAVWGTGLVFEATEPGFEGYYEYCYHIYWDTTEYGGHGLSHSTIYLALAGCECACDPGFFGHRVPAGLAFGEESCEIDMYSTFDCPGDPHFPLDGPTMKFEPDETNCELGVTGWMHVCYFSLFPPTEPGIFEDHLGIKFGLNVETGDLDGVIPYCDCSGNPTEFETWGTIKALYQ
jgi:hypothetical protein